MPVTIPSSILHQHLSSLTNQHILITGGNGFLGQHILQILQSIGSHCVIYDIQAPKQKQDHNDSNQDQITYIQGDLLDTDRLLHAMKKCTGVIHVASPSPVSKNIDLFNNVNIKGTENIIHCMKHHGIQRLVYTSSASVIFDGTDQENMNETAPYPPTHLMDPYTRSKLAAEKIVRQANTDNAADNTSSQSQQAHTLYTCCLRPHGIIGQYPYDPYAITNMVNVGLTCASKYQLGDGHNLVDWTYVENVAYAHCLALTKLYKNSVVNGSVYFITNNNPVSFWHLPISIYQALNVTTPYIYIPPTIILTIARVWESLHQLIPTRRIIPAPPVRFSTQAVKYSTLHHYYNSMKALNELEYIPPIPYHIAIQKIQDSVKHLAVKQKSKSSGNSQTHSSSSPPSLSSMISPYYKCMLCLIFLCITTLIFLPSSSSSSPHYNYTTLRSIILTFLLYLLYHIYRSSTFGETVRSADPSHTITLNNKTVLITGGNKGIGYDTAVALVQRGAHVIIATRDQQRGEEAVKKIQKLIEEKKAHMNLNGNMNINDSQSHQNNITFPSYGAIERMELNLSSLQSVVDLVNTLNQRQMKIDILINNAAAMVEPSVTSDHIDTQFQCNYLSHTLLTLLLLHYQRINTYGRIINVSSLMHYVGHWPLDDSILRGTSKTVYNRLQMYNNTKLYQIMFSNKLHRILRGYTLSHSIYHTIGTLSVHPGACNTEFVDHFVPVWFHRAGNWLLNTCITRTAQQGTESIVYAAISPKLQNVGGMYVDNCEHKIPSAIASSIDAQNDLWQKSIQLLRPHLPKDFTLTKEWTYE